MVDVTREAYRLMSVVRLFMPWPCPAIVPWPDMCGHARSKAYDGERVFVVVRCCSCPPDPANDRRPELTQGRMFHLRRVWVREMPSTIVFVFQKDQRK